MKSSGPIDLYFAFTPLHLRIVNSFKKINPSVLIVLNSRELDDYVKSYILKNEFKDILIFKKKYFSLWDLLRLKLRFNNIINIYVGNFKFINFRLVHFFLNYINLITFDDGIGSVTGDYFRLEKKSFKEFLYSLAGVSINKIFEKHKKHFSIYSDDKPDNFKNSELLTVQTLRNFFDYNGNVLITTDKSEAGTLSIYEERQLFEKIRSRFDIKYVIHHPFKRYNIEIEGSKVIDIPFLSEDVISNSNFDHVFTLSASTVLGIENFGHFPLKKLTYLANHDAENYQEFKKKGLINLFAFEDL